VGALTLALFEFASFLWVDDTDNIHTAKDVHTRAADVLEEFQESVDWWEGILRSTGGGINPDKDKSFWCLLDRKWTGTSWVYMTKEDVPGEISIRQPGTEERTTLHRIEPNESKVTLGVSIAFDGSWTGEFERLKAKAKTYASRIWTGSLTRNEGLYSLRNSIFATFKYPLAAINLSKEQWETIMSIAMQAGLPKSGISRKFPLMGIYSPHKYQGLGFMHLYDEMHLEHLTVLLDHCNRNTLTGHLLQICYQDIKLEIGLPDPGAFKIVTFCTIA